MVNFASFLNLPFWERHKTFPWGEFICLKREEGGNAHLNQDCFSMGFPNIDKPYFGRTPKKLHLNPHLTRYLELAAEYLESDDNYMLSDNYGGINTGVVLFNLTR